jgi:dTDP-4-dehydrorhamnose 3,5-epimerase
MEEIVFSNGSRAIPTNLQDCYIIEPAVFGDNRGYFSPYFIANNMEQLGFERVVQTNRSLSSKGVLRGLHFQKNPFAQAKIVEVLAGKAIDVVVDMRVGSPTYGMSTDVLLMPYNKEIPESGRQLYVPRGFAHGFISLEDNTLFQYIIDNDYAPKMEDGILWNDEELDIPWSDMFKSYGLTEDDILLSEKDQVRLPLKDREEIFTYTKRLK